MHDFSLLCSPPVLVGLWHIASSYRAIFTHLAENLKFNFPEWLFFKPCSNKAENPILKNQNVYFFLIYTVIRTWRLTVCIIIINMLVKYFCWLECNEDGVFAHAVCSLHFMVCSMWYKICSLQYTVCSLGNNYFESMPSCMTLSQYLVELGST